MDNHPFSACRKRKRKTIEKEAVRSYRIEGTHYYSQGDRKENYKLVSPFFNHEYPPGTKIEIASKKTDKAKALLASSDSNRQGKEIVVSPYFKHSYPSGTKVEIALKKTANAKVLLASDNNGSQGKKQEKVQKEKKQEKQLLTVSPYLNDSNYSKEECKIVVKEKTVGQTPHYGTPNPSSSSSLFSIEREGEEFGESNRFNPEKVHHEKQELVVSPYFDNRHYFDNSHYPKDKFIIVVKEKAIEKSSGNPFSSSSSLFSIRREGEGCSKNNRFNPFLEAYRRKSEHNYWTPPKSRYELLQESYYQDPWKVLVICMLLNRTTGQQARQVISDLFMLCPDASSAMKVEALEIERIICSLGLQKKDR